MSNYYAKNRLTAWHRPRRIAELLAVLWIIGLSDLWLTLSVHGTGYIREANPLASTILQNHSDSGLIFFKIACMSLATLTLWRIRHTRRCELAVWGMTLVYFGLLFHWSNITNLALAR